MPTKTKQEKIKNQNDERAILICLGLAFGIAIGFAFGNSTTTLQPNNMHVFLNNTGNLVITNISTNHISDLELVDLSGNLPFLQNKTSDAFYTGETQPNLTITPLPLGFYEIIRNGAYINNTANPTGVLIFEITESCNDAYNSTTCHIYAEQIFKS